VSTSTHERAKGLLTQLAELLKCCRFMRVGGCRAHPLINVLKQLSSTVAMRNGGVVENPTDMKDQIPAGYVQKWLFKTGFVWFPLQLN
jgi:hypothetical protein